MEGYFDSEQSEDLSYSELATFPEFLMDRREQIQSLHLEHNSVVVLPRCIGYFANLVELDISNNDMSYISPEIVHLHKLRTLVGKNNSFDNESIPKDFGLMESLEVVNFSGNSFTDFPMQFTEITTLRYVYLGANNIRKIPSAIGNMSRLEVLYLGGNKLSEVPAEMGYLVSLMSLSLCDNRIESLPSTFINLRNLRSLSLHNNRLSTLPPQIVSLDLEELSLRNNPLVVRFVQNMTFDPPSLLELAGRTVKAYNVHYTEKDLPKNLVVYLATANRCVNPKCKGVYFKSKIESVKFVDFCGKYRLPLLQYLCSPSCTPDSPTIECSSESESEENLPYVKMKRVLLG